MQRHHYIRLGLVLVALAIIFQIFLANPTMMKGFWVGTPLALAAVLFLWRSNKESLSDNFWIDLFAGLICLVFALIVSAPAFSYWF